MKKLLLKLAHKTKFFRENILFFLTLFLIVFIPLYPKLPLVDIENTWVYIRAEDFVVVVALFIWSLFLFARKITLKTPLTIPIFAYWIVGGLATLHGILLIFPNLANVFPNVAFLSYIRHIEYLSLFFIAYSAVKNKKSLMYIFAALVVAFTGVVAYGFGQKYLSFPAYLTMNEEFAKGIPIQLSALARVPSTFAGHYDLAAYLVLVIPILASVFFGIRNWFLRLFLAALSLAGFVIMVLTVSRVSFVSLLVSLFIVLLFQKKKLVLFSLPVIFILGFLFITFNSNLLARYTNTVSVADVLVNAKTGEAVGNIEYVPIEYFDDKSIKLQRIEDREELTEAISGEFEEDEATTSALLPIELLPPGTLVPLVKASNISTGETLPQGTGYINLSLSPVENRVGDFYYELSPDVVEQKGDAFNVVNFHGNFIIKKASAYDLSFTTRFQGEWPNALLAFSRNVLLGSGYGSISLAIDNNFLRMLGETGLLGTGAFFAIFIVATLYIKRNWSHIDSKFVKSFIVGYIAGVIGLMLNATLIDVFEASKVAFVLWLLTGIVIGTIHFYEKSPMNVYNALKKAAFSVPAYILYILLTVIVVFLPLSTNFFVADDFTWFRWAIDCGDSCGGLFGRFFHYFTSSEGFFFRPGTKAYFALMYDYFWLNQNIYHLVSITLHFLVLILFFLLSLKVLKDKLLSAVITILFTLMSGYTEIVFWISGTGHLFNALFILLSLYLFTLWQEKKRILLLILSLLSASFSLLFHELGVVVPFLIISYAVVFGNVRLKKIISHPSLFSYFIPVGLYLLLRFFSKSHWFNGDYSYDIIKLPFNAIGNAIGYVLITFFGPAAFPLYNSLRAVLRENILVSGIAGIILLVMFYFIVRYFIRILTVSEKKVFLFGIFFFIISLLPFLGLGNITARYSYLATFGLLLIFAVVLKRVFEALLLYGKDIAISSVTVFIFVFSLFHIIQVQKLHSDWRGAGDMVERFFISVDSEYDNSWSEDVVELHFVNVPIKFGDAWIFPVGLDDALYLSFRNNELKIFKHATVEEARGVITPALQNRIFEFQPDGSIKEVPTGFLIDPLNITGNLRLQINNP